ncbi:hypothetical protein L1D34_22095 [Vibrio mediterranei]|nr:hypothetical protein [Vibrio mediterranei]
MAARRPTLLPTLMITDVVLDAADSELPMQSHNPIDALSSTLLSNDI